jgi:hypothetical protein
MLSDASCTTQLMLSRCNVQYADALWCDDTFSGLLSHSFLLTVVFVTCGQRLLAVFCLRRFGKCSFSPYRPTLFGFSYGSSNFSFLSVDFTFSFRSTVIYRSAILIAPADVVNLYMFVGSQQVNERDASAKQRCSQSVCCCHYCCTSVLVESLCRYSAVADAEFVDNTLDNTITIFVAVVL